jgi:hypothetical protein
MAAARTIPDEQLGRLLDLMKASDAVELKLTVPEHRHRSTVVALGMDPLESQLRQIFFFDTPELKLDSAGLVARARRIQGKGDDSVVKLRPVEPSEVRPELRALPDFKVEVDAMPGGYVASASLKNTLGPKAVRRVALDGQPIRKLFSKQQRSFFAEHAPEDVSLDDLRVLGPIFVLKLRATPKGFDRRMVAELWFYPDGTRIAELSTRCLPDEAFQVAAEMRAYLSEKGVDVSGEQQTKTRTALEFFAQDSGGETT